MRACTGLAQGTHRDESWNDLTEAKDQPESLRAGCLLLDLLFVGFFGILAFEVSATRLLHVLLTLSLSASIWYPLSSRPPNHPYL